MRCVTVCIQYILLFLRSTLICTIWCFFYISLSHSASLSLSRVSLLLLMSRSPLVSRSPSHSLTCSCHRSLVNYLFPWRSAWLSFTCGQRRVPSKSKVISTSPSLSHSFSSFLALSLSLSCSLLLSLSLHMIFKSELVDTHLHLGFGPL